MPGTEDGDASSDSSGAIDCEQRCTEQGACGESAEATCLANCIETQQAADAVGQACGQAYVEFQDCQTQRTCAQIEEESGCEAEVELVMDACAELAPAVCEAVCPKWIECGLIEQQYCLGTCALQVGFARVIGDACGTAYEGLYACEAELECAELEADHCPQEQAAGEQACE